MNPIQVSIHVTLLQRHQTINAPISKWSRAELGTTLKHVQTRRWGFNINWFNNTSDPSFRPSKEIHLSEKSGKRKKGGGTYIYQESLLFTTTFRGILFLNGLQYCNTNSRRLSSSRFRIPQEIADWVWFFLTNNLQFDVDFVRRK